MLIDYKDFKTTNSDPRQVFLLVSLIVRSNDLSTNISIIHRVIFLPLLS